MSSEEEMSSQRSSPLDGQTQPRNRNFSILLPLILGLAAPAPSQDNQDGENRTAPERVVLVDPITGSLIIIEGSGNLDLANKDGPLPASKASIEAMPAVKITEEGTECAICLGEYEVGGEAKEMPCKHRYHSGCIEKWLGIHGSCPVCRYNMPVEEGTENKKGGDGNEGEENRGREADGEIRISFFFGGGGHLRDSNSSTASNSADSSADARRTDDGAAADGSSAQDMEIDNN